MTEYQNVSGDVVDIPHLDLRVQPDEVIDVDPDVADLSQNPHFAPPEKPAPKPRKPRTSGAARPSRARKPKDAAPAAPEKTEAADAALTEGQN